MTDIWILDFARQLALLSFLCGLATFSHAYTFNIASDVRQCENIIFNIVGAGSPPYSVALIPFGPSPLQVDPRSVVETTSSSTSISLQLPYPADSQFIAVVSDATGFGTGGTTAAATVLNGTSGCFNPNVNFAVDFFYNIAPSQTLSQCSNTRIWWDPTTVQGTPQFFGVIPAGQSFEIAAAQGGYSNITNEGLGFNWDVNVPAGTTVMLVGGDNRGFGNGGSVQFTIDASNSGNGCLDGSSPSSTAGSPAGGSYPTSTSGAGTGGSRVNPSNVTSAAASGTGSPVSGGSSPTSSSGGSGSTPPHHSSTNIAVIAGSAAGGAGGIVIALLLCILLRRRSRRSHHVRHMSVDLLGGYDNSFDQRSAPPAAPQVEYLQPEPLPPPLRSVHGESVSVRTSNYDSMSAASTPVPSLATVGTSVSAGTKSSKSTTRLVATSSSNIIQHDDAGHIPEEESVSEPVELPPAYNSLRRNTMQGGAGLAQNAGPSNPSSKDR